MSYGEWLFSARMTHLFVKGNGLMRGAVFVDEAAVYEREAAVFALLTLVSNSFGGSKQGE